MVNDQEDQTRGSAVVIEVSYFADKKQWFALPMSVRQRWWKETDYGRKQPSSELIQCIATALETVAAAPAR